MLNSGSLRQILFFFIFVFHGKNYCQSFSSHDIALIPEDSIRISFSEENYRNTLLIRYENSFKLKERKTDFINENVEEAKEIFGGNYIYTNLEKETHYLKQLLEKTIPKEYLGENLKVYLVRDATPNAFCREDGSIFVHVGLLQLFDNEAELAAVLCHEFGHYYMQHSLKEYKQLRNANLGLLFSSVFSYYGLFAAPVIKMNYFQHSREREQESDLFTIKFFKQNNFPPKSISNSFSKIMRYEQKLAKLKYYKGSSVFYRTHPLTATRLKYLEDSITRMTNTGKQFQVDSMAFLNVRTRCIDECIYLLLQNGSYNDALELAYHMHLQTPMDQFYIYFVSEILQRNLTFKPTSSKELFITNRYNLPINKKNKTKDNKHQSVHFYLKELYEINDSCSNKKIYCLLDTNNIEFITNAEALEYFNTLTKRNKETDLELMNDLELYNYKQLHAQEISENTKKNVNPIYFNCTHISERGSRFFSSELLSYSSEPVVEFIKYRQDLSTEDQMAFDTVYTLNFKANNRERELWNVWLNIISAKLIEDNYGNFSKRGLFFKKEHHISTNVNLKKLLPEFYLMASEHNYHKIFFIDLIEKQPGRYSSGYRVTVDAMIYCVDFDCSTVHRYFKKCKMSYTYKPDYRKFSSELMKHLNQIKTVHGS